MILTALWRRLDVPGHDAARLEAHADGHTLTGYAVFVSGGQPAALRYRVDLATDWTTIAASMHGFVGSRPVAAEIRRDPPGWTLNGERQPDVEGLADLDFGFTPATNLQQLRRLNLAVGKEADLPVAWLDAGATSLTRLAQRYRRLDASLYAYDAPAVPYRATLAITKSGFVGTYPGLWEITTERQEPISEPRLVR